MLKIVVLCLLGLTGCGCDNEVVADVTVSLDGGTSIVPTEYCAQGCTVTADCRAGYYCSPVVNRTSGPTGLCFQNGH